MSDNIKDALRECVLLSTLRKRIDEMLNERREVTDGYLLAKMDEDGTDRLKIKTDSGEDIGTLSISFAKSTEELVSRVKDYTALVHWLESTDEGHDAIVRIVNAKPAWVAEVAAADGLVPDGVECEVVRTPAHAKGVTLRPASPDKVVEAYGEGLAHAVASMLGLPTASPASIEEVANG